MVIIYCLPLRMSKNLGTKEFFKSEREDKKIDPKGDKAREKVVILINLIVSLDVNRQ